MKKQLSKMEIKSESAPFSFDEDSTELVLGLSIWSALAVPYIGCKSKVDV